VSLKLEILQLIITITAINMIILAVAIPVKGVVGLPNNSQKPITNTTWVRARFVSYKKGGLNSQPQAIKVTCPWLVVLSGFFHN
jgi:hypothetical protein